MRFHIGFSFRPKQIATFLGIVAAAVAAAFGLGVVR